MVFVLWIVFSETSQALSPSKHSKHLNSRKPRHGGHHWHDRSRPLRPLRWILVALHGLEVTWPAEGGVERGGEVFKRFFLNTVMGGSSQ